MPEDKRNEMLNSEAFKNRFSPAEVQMLTDISQNYPIPGGEEPGGNAPSRSRLRLGRA